MAGVEGTVVHKSDTERVGCGVSQWAKAACSQAQGIGAGEIHTVGVLGSMQCPQCSFFVKEGSKEGRPYIDTYTQAPPKFRPSSHSEGGEPGGFNEHSSSLSRLHGVAAQQKADTHRWQKRTPLGRFEKQFTLDYDNPFLSQMTSLFGLLGRGEH